ncbi:MAG: AAA domain-containing protein, partial [Novosphingobium sp.]
KNHQAVDVVEARVNSLTPYPALLRMGAKTVQAVLADRLNGILSQRADASVPERHAHVGRTLAKATTRLAEIDQTLERVRTLANDIAQRDALLTDFRERLGAERWNALATFDPAQATADLAAFGKAAERASRENQTIFVRMLWPFLRQGREEALTAALAPVRRMADALAVPETATRPWCTALKAAIATAGDARAVLASEQELSSLGDPGRHAQERLDVQRSLGVASITAFECWLAEQGARLSQSQRKALGDYIALLRSIARTQEDGGAVARASWAKYYKLAAEVSSCLPGWAITSLSVKGRVPFDSGLFDLVIIDEASQCDIASALPLLFRAKRAVVIGDPRQLRHITRLPEQKNHALMLAHGVMENPGPAWSYAESSLYDLVASRVPADAIIGLRDHHRSHPDIIGFSNEVFYEGALRVATDQTRLASPDGPALRWIDVVGAVERPRSGSARNVPEAQSVLAELRRLTLEQDYRGTIGVVTPFRAQANFIRERIETDPALRAVLAARDIRVGTADTYQGDERDLMIFSPVLAAGMTDGAAVFLARDANRINVALTRARAALVVVGDKTVCAGEKVPILARLVRHAEAVASRRPDNRPAQPAGSPDYPWVPDPDKVSDYERDLYRALAQAGIYTIPQHPVDAYRLDLALIAPDGRRLDIEVDGERYHLDPWTRERLHKDLLRDMRMVEMGWDVRRFWAVQVRDDMAGCVAAVQSWLDCEAAPPTP